MYGELLVRRFSVKILCGENSVNYTEYGNNLRFSSTKNTK